MAVGTPAACSAPLWPTFIFLHEVNFTDTAYNTGYAIGNFCHQQLVTAADNQKLSTCTCVCVCVCVCMCQWMCMCANECECALCSGSTELRPKTRHIPQPTSSDPSSHAGSPSHTQRCGMHSQSSHWNIGCSKLLQGRWRQCASPTVTGVSGSQGGKWWTCIEALVHRNYHQQINATRLPYF